MSDDALDFPEKLILWELIPVHQTSIVGIVCYMIANYLIEWLKISIDWFFWSISDDNFLIEHSILFIFVIDFQTWDNHGDIIWFKDIFIEDGSIVSNKQLRSDLMREVIF
jgi:hypothetical protein